MKSSTAIDDSISQFVPSFSCFSNLFYTKTLTFGGFVIFLSLHHFTIYTCPEKWLISSLYNSFPVWPKTLDLSRGLCELHKWERFTAILIVPISRSVLSFFNFKVKENVVFSHLFLFSQHLHRLKSKTYWIEIQQSRVRILLLRKEKSKSKSDL